MLVRTGVCVIGLWLAVMTAWAVEVDELAQIRFARVGGVLYLDCADVAKALDYEWKVVQPQRLITFCRGGEVAALHPGAADSGQSSRG